MKIEKVEKIANIIMPYFLTLNYMSKSKAIWVSPNEKGWWRIHKEWWKRDIAHISTKDWAVERAREIAKNQQAELTIQKRNWVISERNSYWRDPFPPRG